jgi:hypothetical protein
MVLNTYQLAKLLSRMLHAWREAAGLMAETELMLGVRRCLYSLQDVNMSLRSVIG